MRMTTMSSYQEITKSLAGSAKVLQSMNEKMDMASIQTVLKDFNKENMKAEMNQDMVSSEIPL